MKKVIALEIVFLMVLLSFTSISGIQINNQIIKQSSRGNILYVGGSGPGNYSTIQSAIDDASNGDTVFVFDDSSPYYERGILIDKAINLIGENRDTTVIDGQYRFSSIISNIFDGANISGFTIRNSSERGIHVSLMDSIRIYDNHIFNCDIGIGISMTQNISIVSNTFKNCNDSIENHDNCYVRISNNIIKGWSTPQTFYNGEIECFDDYKSIISNNTIINYNEKGYNCLYLLRTKDCIIKNNTIKRYGTAIIMVINDCNTTISHNTFIKNDLGIAISGSSHVTNNNFINNNCHAAASIFSKNVVDCNYWDNWIGLKIPLLSFLPYFGYLGSFIDWHPAKEPYNYTTTQGCGIE